MQKIRLIKQQKLYLRVDFFKTINKKITQKKNTIDKILLFFVPIFTYAENTAFEVTLF